MNWCKFVYLKPLAVEKQECKSSCIKRSIEVIFKKRWVVKICKRKYSEIEDLVLLLMKN